MHATLTPTTQMSYMDPRSHQTLLKTIIAKARSDCITIEANILFDEGARHTFISQSLVSKLGLQTSTKATINLAAFGAISTTRRNLDVATLYIETESYGNIPIQALVVPEIATPLQNSIGTAIENYHYLQDLKRAHPVTDNESFEISLLIGADHYWDIVQDHISRGNGPTAMQSKLGYLLSGRVTSTTNTINPNCPTNMLKVLPFHQEEDGQIERFWNLESLGITGKVSPVEETRYIREYQQTAISREKYALHCKIPLEERSPSPSYEPHCLRETYKSYNQEN